MRKMNSILENGPRPLIYNFTLIPCEKFLNLSKEARILAIIILKLFFANSNSIIKLYQLKLFVREGAVPGSNSQNLLFSIYSLGMKMKMFMKNTIFMEHPVPAYTVRW